MISAEFKSFLMGKIFDGMPVGLTAAFAPLTPDTIDYRETEFQSRRRCFSLLFRLWLNVRELHPLVARQAQRFVTEGMD